MKKFNPELNFLMNHRIILVPDEYTLKQVNNFLSKVSGGEDIKQCWEWQGWRDNKGRGRIKVKGTKIYSHRFSFHIYNGYLPEKPLVIRHTCDNPSCCNPYHLIPGTSKDNSRDMMVRRRNPPKKLDWEKAAEIRYLLKDKVKISKIASIYNITVGVVYLIRDNKMWIV